MSTRDFTSALEELSLIQKEAAMWKGDSLLVLAGPGSGKTRVLTCCIARILDSTPTENFRVLGLTFTNKAADEMRTRVERYVPGQERRLFLGTFHSFCADVLRQHGIHLKINPNFQIYSQDVDLQAVLNDAIEEAKKRSELVSDLEKKTLPVIKRLKSFLILPENCRDAFKNPEFGERMAIVYPSYERELAKRNALDFHSLILKVYQLFKEFPVFAERYRTVYPYICVDEFQDTNTAQYLLLRALTGGDHKNLFVVADDDQIIYQWNGASHRRLEEFKRDYKPKVIQLPMNYRCPPEIVKLANSLIQHNFLRTADKQPLEAFRPTGENRVRLLLEFPDSVAEAEGLAKDIKMRHGKELNSVVVLGRSRKLLEGVQSVLRNENLPAIISQRKDEFVSTPFVWLHSILRLANDRRNRSQLEAVCGTFAQLTDIAIDPENVITQAQASNSDYLQHWIKLIRQEHLTDLIREAVEKISFFLGEGREFQAFSAFALDWFNRLVLAKQENHSDWDREVFARYEEERSVWQTLTKEITDCVGHEITLEAFLQEMQLHSKEPSTDPGTVILMTIHGAKGKEFDHVYLIGLVEDELPSFQSKEKGDDSSEMEEERRSCFVAITRSSETLTLSCAKSYRGWPKEPSRFLYEMGLLSRGDDKSQAGMK